MICQALVPVISNLIETYTTHFRELNTPILHLRARPGWKNAVLREILRMRSYGHEMVGKAVGEVHLLWRNIPKRPHRSPLVRAEMSYELTGEVFLSRKVPKRSPACHCASCSYQLFNFCCDAAIYWTSFVSWSLIYGKKVIADFFNCNKCGKVKVSNFSLRIGFIIHNCKKKSLYCEIWTHNCKKKSELWEKS